MDYNAEENNITNEEEVSEDIMEKGQNMMDLLLETATEYGISQSKIMP